MTRYYILIAVYTSFNEDKSINEKHHEGSLFKEIRAVDQTTSECAKQPEDSAVVVVVNFPKSFLAPLEENEFYLLLSVPLPEENRIKVWRNKEWLNEGLTLYVGSPIVICNHMELSNGTEGVVRYIGPLPSKPGIWYGVELAPQYAGEGTCDGIFRRQRFFHCPDDCGIFVSIYRLRNNEHVPLLRSRGYPLRPPDSDIEDHILKSFPFKLEDRVVWISDDQPEPGTIKWVGRLPDSSDESIIVGVYFENAVGSGTGRYKGQQLFTTPRGHASLMPPLGLIKHSDFYGDSAENLHERLDSMAMYERDVQNTSLETSPPSLTRSADPDIIASAKPYGQTLRSRGPYMDVPLTSANIQPIYKPLQYKFDIGQNVYTLLKEKRYGVIRYIGPHPKMRDRKIAGLEMEIPDPTCYTDGDLAGEKLFNCCSKTAFFVYLEKLYPDDREDVY